MQTYFELWDEGLLNRKLQLLILMKMSQTWKKHGPTTRWSTNCSSDSSWTTKWTRAKSEKPSPTRSFWSCSSCSTRKTRGSATTSRRCCTGSTGGSCPSESLFAKASWTSSSKLLSSMKRIMESLNCSRFYDQLLMDSTLH